jgi:hypothetical protein
VAANGQSRVLLSAEESAQPRSQQSGLDDAAALARRLIDLGVDGLKSGMV